MAGSVLRVLKRTKGELTMRATLSMFVGLAVLAAFAVCIRADEGKEVTLKGEITCAKCDLKKSDSCHTVIKVTEDGKDVVYWFEKDSSKKYHKPVCTEAKKGTVKGTVSEKDGKKYVKVSKLEWAD
jgi:Family of unknown function (DUF6370)